MEMEDMDGMQGHDMDMEGMEGYGEESGGMVSANVTTLTHTQSRFSFPLV